VPAFLNAQEPPPGLARRVAARATEAREALAHYTYRQTVTVEELGANGARAGEYKEIRDVVFSPEGERTEKVAGKTADRLQHLRLTPEDFEDVREVQPFLFDTEQLRAYETKYKGVETMDGVECYLLQVRPRQVLAGQRLFDGLLWASTSDFSIVRTEGKAVPEIRSMKQENLFPRFTTMWEPVDGKYWFPIHTFADDTLDFRVGPQRMRLNIRYADYKRFSAESSIRFEGEKK